MLGVNERGFKVDWSVVTALSFGVPIFLSQLDVAAAMFAFLVLQTKVGRVAVLVP